ncbi:multidrug resistance protein MdtB [Striga asiatica]|uniref:Multidrug resistance protein MdtB n=1 Tax=Striga asiatica TaxID=4170 RepID=A0A5A7PMJ2_STRAF|nr:multidrug resistance protein MdtB [Striga asiatica]
MTFLLASVTHNITCHQAAVALAIYYHIFELRSPFYIPIFMRRQQNTFSKRKIMSFNRISASWNAPSSWETLSSSSSTRRSFSLSFWRRLLVSVSSFDTRDAMAIDVSLRARSSCSYGSVGMTARTSSGRSKSGPTEFPSPPPCAICRRVRSLI